MSKKKDNLSIGSAARAIKKNKARTQRQLDQLDKPVRRAKKKK